MAKKEKEKWRKKKNGKKMRALKGTIKGLLRTLIKKTSRAKK
jgi:hypothetical protein